MEEQRAQFHNVRRMAVGAALALCLVLSLAVAFSLITKKTRDLVRSSSLRAETREEGNVKITEYFDEEGELTFADNLGYAYIRVTEEGNVRLTEYFDAEGNRAKQGEGHVMMRREYDDAAGKEAVTYLDENAQPMTLKSGYAKRVITYNERNKPVSCYYYDLKDEPFVTEYYGFGQFWEYDGNDNSIVVKYQDAEGRPLVTKSGYAEMHRTFYTEGENVGRVKDECYFDETGRVMTLTNGAYGVHRDYDVFGRNTYIGYLNRDGEPMMTTDGYSVIRRTFYEDDNVETEMYYDREDRQVALLEGQYGIRKENGNIEYLDKDGETIFNLKNFLYSSPFVVIVAAAVAIVLSFVLGRRGNAVLLILYVGAIAYMTVFFRSGGESRLELRLFWAYRQFFRDPTMRKEIMDNIWLFIPLGTILYRLYPKKLILLVPVLLSVVIEVLQYVLGIGLAEVDDVISNSLGGVIGIGLGWFFTGRTGCRAVSKN